MRVTINAPPRVAEVRLEISREELMAMVNDDAREIRWPDTLEGRVPADFEVRANNGGIVLVWKEEL